MKSCKWICGILVLLLILAASAPAQAAQDHEWVTYELHGGRQPAAVVSIYPHMYVGTGDGLYMGTGDSWWPVGTGSYTLGSVQGLAYDAETQKMYVSDPDNTRVLVWDMAANTWDRLTTTNFDCRGLSLYRAGGDPIVYVADRMGNYVFEYFRDSFYRNITTGTYSVGAMHLPYDAVRYGDTLYVADLGNNRILVRDADEWSEIVHSTYTQGVTDLAVLSDGTLYFTEYNKDRVMKYADGHFTIVMAGSSLVDGPWGIWKDEWDNLFVCDRLNARIYRSKDNNNNLSILGVDLTPIPGFSPSTTDYYLTYEYSVDSIGLGAAAESPYATYSGTGLKTLSVGENHFTVTVHPEIGPDKDYYVHVTRLEEPNPAFTADLSADKTEVDVGETVTFTLTLANTGDVGFTDMDCINTVSTEHAIADLMLGVGEVKTEEIAVTAQESDAGGAIRLAYEVIGRTVMGHEIHVSTGMCSVTVMSPTPEPSATPEITPEPSATPVAVVSPEVSPETSPEISPEASLEASPTSPEASLNASSEAVPAVEMGGMNNVLLWTVGGVLLLLLCAIIALLILLARQKKAPGKLPPVGPAPAPETSPAEESSQPSGEADTDAQETEEADTGIPETEEADTDIPETEEEDTDIPETEEADTGIPETEEADTDIPEGTGDAGDTSDKEE